jgi:hypothetical protein
MKIIRIQITLILMKENGVRNHFKELIPDPIFPRLENWKSQIVISNNKKMKLMGQDPLGFLKGHL